MKIVVVGLGLIGGSFCKCLKKRTKHIIYGWDVVPDVLEQAVQQGAIDGIAGREELTEADLTILCVYPKQAVAFIKEHREQFRPGSVIIDTCGVKQAVVGPAEQLLQGTDICFVGTHPMAGREFSGFAYAVDNLFDSASLIITETPYTDRNAVQAVRTLAEEMRFKGVVISTPEEHDRIIAYTSQLAHVVSNAFIKSPTSQMERGYSAGSFRDLTRVAKLNPVMWTELFLENREALGDEIDEIIRHLAEYRKALREGNETELFRLLKEGSDRKEKSGE